MIFWVTCVIYDRDPRAATFVPLILRFMAKMIPSYLAPSSYYLIPIKDFWPLNGGLTTSGKFIYAEPLLSVKMQYCPFAKDSLGQIGEGCWQMEEGGGLLKEPQFLHQSPPNHVLPLANDAFLLVHFDIDESNDLAFSPDVKQLPVPNQSNQGNNINSAKLLFWFQDFANHKMLLYLPLFSRICTKMHFSCL